ncbi:MAG: hypothetical protein JOY98_02860, partial [Candidatus Eremiobacteraeota bacterium]|nr:hypothetical protein [Candidatus Eremiobacteraeota bacterium]
SALRGEGIDRLAEPAELALVRRLAEFPRTIAAVAEGLAPQRLARYAQSVAADFHSFYMQCRVIGEDVQLSAGRLALAHATKIVLARVLTLLGVSAPDSMPELPGETEP